MPAQAGSLITPFQFCPCPTCLLRHAAVKHYVIMALGRHHGRQDAKHLDAVAEQQHLVATLLVPQRQQALQGLRGGWAVGSGNGGGNGGTSS